MLMSARISGQREHHGEIVAVGDWPAVVTAAQTARLRATLGDPTRRTSLIDSVTLTELRGVASAVIERKDLGEFLMRFELEEPVPMGTLIRWGYKRITSYADDTPPQPTRGHTSISAFNPGFEMSLRVQFLGPPPPLVWFFQQRKMYVPGSPNFDAVVTPDSDGCVEYSLTNDTDEHHAYGVAWQWR